MTGSSEALSWILKAIATWHAAAIIGGVTIALIDAFTLRIRPSDEDVKRAADRYRQTYGENAIAVIDDHITGALFAPDRRHSAFLRRVMGELIARLITEEEQQSTIGHSL